MKRLFALIAALSMLVVASPAAAGGNAVPAKSHAYGASLLTWQQRWVQWAFGSSTNPLLSGICGEKVGRLFFLNAAIEPGTEVNCVIPTGTPLLATAGGAFAWAPTDGQTREELLASRDAAFVGITDPRATLDGRPLRVADSLRFSDVYTIRLEPGNFVQTVDPGVPGDSTRVATAGWFVRITPLSPGQHELVLSDVIDGTVFDVTFHITVRRGK
jgi:hypothetical protein